MKKPVEELDLDFDNISLGLYVVYDSTTDIEVTGVFTVANDAAAVGGFVEFMKANNEEKKPFSRYVLKTVGFYNSRFHRIETGEDYDIISDDEDYEKYFEDICNIIKNNEEKE